MESGKLRNKLFLQSSTESRDAIGGVTDSWATIATVYGSIVRKSDKEMIESDRLTQTVTHTIRIRYYAGVTPSYRLLFGSRVFSIIKVNDMGERNRTMVLDCIEEL